MCMTRDASCDNAGVGGKLQALVYEMPESDARSVGWGQNMEGAGRGEGSLGGVVKNEKAPDNLKVKQTVYCRFIVRCAEDFCSCWFVTAATQRSSAGNASSICQCAFKQKWKFMVSERSGY